MSDLLRSDLEEDIEDVKRYVMNKRMSEEQRRRHLQLNLTGVYTAETIKCFEADAGWNAKKGCFAQGPIDWNRLIKSMTKIGLSSIKYIHQDLGKLTAAPSSLDEVEKPDRISDEEMEMEEEDEREEEGEEEEGGEAEETETEVGGSGSSGIDEDFSDVDELVVEWKKTGLGNVRDIESFLEKAEDLILKGQELGRQGPKDHFQDTQVIVAAKSEMGSACFHALMAVLAKKHKVLSVFITTSAERCGLIFKDLTEKIIPKLPPRMQPICLTALKFETKEFDDALKRCLGQYGTVLMACSQKEIDKIYNKIKQFRVDKDLDFVLIKDECDGNLDEQTSDRDLELDKAVDRLTGRRTNDSWIPPLLILKLSKTLLPIFMRLRHNTFSFEEGFGKVASEACGRVENIEAINGLFLCDNELRQNNRPKSFWSDSVSKLYLDAHPADSSSQKGGVLLLDTINSQNGYQIEHRADIVQRDYPRFTVVLIEGSGALVSKVRISADGPWLSGESLKEFILGKMESLQACSVGRARTSECSSLLSVLSALAKMGKASKPIAVFGCSTTMLYNKGRIFGSMNVNTCADHSLEDAVSHKCTFAPTHLLCVFDHRRSFEDLAQQIVHATYACKETLRRNGHQKLKILTNWRYYDSVCSYYNFQNELATKLKTKDLTQALSEMQHTYGASSDFAQQISRVGSSESVSSFLFPLEEGGPQLGRRWAELSGFRAFGKHGQVFHLDSPFSADERQHFSKEERLIELHLYHSTFCGDALSLVVRKVVSDFKPDVDNWKDRKFWDEAFGSISYVSFNRDGIAKVNPGTKSWTQYSQSRFEGSELPILQRRLSRHTTREEHECSLNEAILDFARKYKTKLSSKPPKCTKEYIRALAEKFAQESVVSKSHLALRGEAIPCKELSDQDLCTILRECWVNKIMERLTACATRDPGTFENVGLTLKNFVACRPANVSCALELLYWLVQKDLISLEDIRRTATKITKIFPDVSLSKEVREKMPSSKTLPIATWIVRAVQGAFCIREDEQKQVRREQELRGLDPGSICVGKTRSSQLHSSADQSSLIRNGIPQSPQAIMRSEADKAEKGERAGAAHQPELSPPKKQEMLPADDKRKKASRISQSIDESEEESEESESHFPRPGKRGRSGAKRLVSDD